MEEIGRRSVTKHPSLRPRLPSPPPPPVSQKIRQMKTTIRRQKACRDNDSDDDNTPTNINRSTLSKQRNSLEQSTCIPRLH